jgi:shikimate kinase
MTMSDSLQIQRGIALVGMMGCGKSAAGRQLARRLGYRFVDLDAAIETAAGMSVSQLFTTRGEEAFRQLEAETLRQIAPEQTVLACGGGTPAFHDNLSWLLDRFVTVYLHMSPEALLSRLTHSSHKRPLLAGKSREDQLETLTGLLAARQAHYQRAHVVVEGLNLDTDRLMEAIRLYQPG